MHPSAPLADCNQQAVMNLLGKLRERLQLIPLLWRECRQLLSRTNLQAPPSFLLPLFRSLSIPKLFLCLFDHYIPLYYVLMLLVLLLSRCPPPLQSWQKLTALRKNLDLTHLFPPAAPVLSLCRFKKQIASCSPPPPSSSSSSSFATSSQPSVCRSPPHLCCFNHLQMPLQKPRTKNLNPLLTLPPPAPSVLIPLFELSTNTLLISSTCNDC